VVDPRIIQLADERPLAAAPLGQVLRLSGIVEGAGAFAGQFAADGRRGAAEVGSNLVLVGALVDKFGDAIAFLDRKAPANVSNAHATIRTDSKRSCIPHPSATATRARTW
jgi:hypothetical protein